MLPSLSSLIQCRCTVVCCGIRYLPGQWPPRGRDCPGGCDRRGRPQPDAVPAPHVPWQAERKAQKRLQKQSGKQKKYLQKFQKSNRKNLVAVHAFYYFVVEWINRMTAAPEVCPPGPDSTGDAPDNA